MDMYSLNNIYMKKVFSLLTVLLVLLCSCKQKTIIADDEKKPVITITVTNVTSNEIQFTTECSDPDVTYYVYGMTKAKYLTESTYSSDSIYGFDKSWFEFVSQSSGEPWYELMLDKCVKGKQSYSFSDFTYVLDPESDYVIYAYGIDDVGERITYVHTCEVTTAEMVPSTNEISVEITQTYVNGVDATFTTTNNDTYFVSLQRKTYVEFFQGEGHTLGEMAVDILSADISANGEIVLLSGDQTITTDDYRCQKKDADYYLIYFAYDKQYGRRSEVHLVPFRTAAE